MTNIFILFLYFLWLLWLRNLSFINTIWRKTELGGKTTFLCTHIYYSKTTEHFVIVFFSNVLSTIQKHTEQKSAQNSYPFYFFINFELAKPPKCRRQAFTFSFNKGTLRLVQTYLISFLQSSMRLLWLTRNYSNRKCKKIMKKLT